MPASQISNSLFVVNVPEVSNLSNEFVYKFYTADERVASVNGLNSNLAPRHVALSWSPLTKFENYKYIIGTETTQEIIEKSISEDDTFTKNFYSKNFSEITDIEHAALELNDYVSKVSSGQRLVSQLKFFSLGVALTSNNNEKQKSEEFTKQVKQIYDSFDALVDLPTKTLGIDFVGEDGKLIDKEDLLKNLASSLSLNIKVSKMVVEDVLVNSDISQDELDQFIKANFKSQNEGEDEVFAIGTESKSVNQAIADLPRIKGYLLTRFRYDQEGKLTQEFVKYLNNPSSTSYNDSGVVYGGTYVYSISVVAEIDVVGEVINNNNQTGVLTLNVLSRPSLTSVSCFEAVPPPPPADIKFNFDYIKRNVIITWDFPANPQSDIKQFQIFRRRSLDDAFELIAHYGFDRSLTGFVASPNLNTIFNSTLDVSKLQNKRYTTGEIVDANDIENMNPDYRYLVKDLDLPVYRHVDQDFVIDNEFFETTSFIYAMCSIDAHGMISNYSSQYRVSFDFFKNRLITELICDEGSPRTYPNLNLRSDFFKDAINTTGMKLNELDVYYSPDRYNILDEQGKLFEVVALQKPNDPVTSYYQLQITNLDNQLQQMLKINIEKPELPPQDIITVIQQVDQEPPPLDLSFDEV